MTTAVDVDRYKKAISELLQKHHVWADVTSVDVVPPDGIHLKWSASPILRVVVGFWGGGATVHITQQALDTTLGGTSFIAGLDKAAESISQGVLNTATYKRIDAIIGPAKALVTWARTLRRAQQSSGLTAIKAVEDAVASEHAIRSSASATPIATDAATSVGPHEA